MAEKIYKIQKELEEKRAKRKRELPTQPPTQPPQLPNTPGQQTGPRQINPTAPRMPGPGPPRMPTSTPGPNSIPGHFPMDQQNPLTQQTSVPVTSIPGLGNTEQSVLRNQLMAGTGMPAGQNGQIRPGAHNLGPSVSIPVNNPNMPTMTQDQHPSMLMQQLGIPPASDPKAADIKQVATDLASKLPDQNYGKPVFVYTKIY